MHSPQLILLLISLSIFIIAGAILLYKRKYDKRYIDKVKKSKGKPLMRGAISGDKYMKERFFGMGCALVGILIMILLVEIGVI